MPILTKLITALFAILLSLSAAADIAYTCTHGAQTRIISVVYETPGQSVPCAVTYTKQGTTKTLWSAQNQLGFCEDKADLFVEKQRGWGWNCE